MTIKINRTGIFLLGTLIIYAFYLQNRLKIVLYGTVTTGKIISVDDVDSDLWSNKKFDHGTCAMYEAPGMGVYYADNPDRDLHVGRKVNVIYLNRNPAVAYVYDFYNFWLIGLLMTIIPMILWLSFALGYVNPNKVITIKIP